MYIPHGDPRATFSENPSSMISCFPTPSFGPKRSPVQNVGQRGPDLAPKPKNQKDARRKMVQNPAGINSNGARRCKLWPKTILGGIV